jgi:hypothetical protein
MGRLACDSLWANGKLIRGGRHDAAIEGTWLFRRSAPQKGGAYLLRRLRAQRTVCLRRLGGGHAGEVRLSRFLNSPRVTATEMLATAARHCAGRAAGRHVLAIQDTSEINYQAHAGRVKGLGPAGNGRDLGFFIHPLLVADAASGGIIGLAGGRIWKRKGKVAVSRRRRAMEDKESRRWLEGAQDAMAALQDAAMVTVVGDSESDIYDLFAVPRAQNAHLLVRAAQDRCLVSGGKLFAHAQSLPEREQVRIKIGAKPGQKARTAQVAIGFDTVRLKRPSNARKGDLPGETGLQLVAVRETDPPAGVEPVCWVLLTTHRVESLEDARQIVNWYRKRWLIEQLFRCVKTQGYNVEESQLVQGHALMNLAAAALIAAMQTLQLTLARNRATGQPLSDAFGEAEARVLAAIEKELPGKTAKQSNPHPPDCLAWAAWIIARLGGWTGYPSQKPPGPKTIYLGLVQFEAIAKGWLLCEENP